MDRICKMNDELICICSDIHEENCLGLFCTTRHILYRLKSCLGNLYLFSKQCTPIDSNSAGCVERMVEKLCDASIILVLLV